MTSTRELPIRVRIGDNVSMIEKVVIRRPLGDPSARKADLEYWLSRPSGERMEAVEELRRHFYGDLPRLQRVARVGRIQDLTDADALGEKPKRTGKTSRPRQR